MKTYSFKALAICLAIFTCAQVQAQSWETKYLKYWSDVPLDSSDFIKRKSADNNTIGVLSRAIDYKWGWQQVGNLQFETVNTRLTMDKLNSWYDPALVGDLKYFQTEFDILETLRRQMQNEINNDPSRAADIINYYERLCDSKISAFCEECKYGKDKRVVDSIAADISKALAEVPEEPLKAPKIGNKEYGLSFYAGYTFEKYTGAVGMGVPYGNCFRLGLGLYYGPVGLFVDITGGSGSALKTSDFYYDEINDYCWVQDRPTTTGVFNILAEYRIFDSNYFAIAPFAGVGTSFIEQDIGLAMANGDELSSRLSGIRLSAGLKLSYKYFRSISDGGVSERNLNLLLYPAFTNYKGLGQCYSFNVGVCFDLSTWNTKLK